MQPIILNVDWNGTPTTIRITEVSGMGGDNWHIYVNGYYDGSAIRIRSEIVFHMGPKSELTTEDLDIIRRLIEEASLL